MIKKAFHSRFDAARLPGPWLGATRVGLVITAALATSACETYVPAKPGTYRARGEPATEPICGFETPTASRFLQMRCRSAEEMNRLAAEARESADGLRTPVPDTK